MTERRAILEANRMAREGRTLARHAPLGEHILRIPVADWPAIRAGFPGLESRDHSEYELAVRAFLASPASEPYKVRKPRRR
jgi:hypothetical protein